MQHHLAGLVGWLHQGQVLNLDGVVNRAAFEALSAGELDAYLDRNRVAFVLDHPVQFAVGVPWPHAGGVHFGPRFDPERDLREIARFVVPGVDAGRPGTDSFRLYQRAPYGVVRPEGPRCEDLGSSADGGRDLAWRGRDGERLSLRCDGQNGETFLAEGIAGVTIVVAAPAGSPGICRLFVSGQARPILEYRRL